MKYSRYNSFVFNENGNLFIVNCLHKSIIQIAVRLKEIIDSIKDNINLLYEIHPELFACMKYNNMIIMDSVDEVNEANTQRKKYLNQSQTLYVTINPTLDCNLRCWYCYEDHHIGSLMNTKTQNNIVEFVKAQYIQQDIKSLHVAFFGGEPLLGYRRVIIPLLTELSLFCKRKNISLHHHYTTNGTLLSPNKVDALLSISSKMSVQISFDGNRLWHNKTKSFASGVGSFDLTKTNLLYIAQRGIMTTIRCNLTQNNAISFRELIKNLKEIIQLNNVRVSFQNVWQEESKLEMKEIVRILQQSLKTTRINSNIHNFYHRHQPCICDYSNSFVFNYDGGVFKCTARNFNECHKMGELINGGNILFNDCYHIRKQSQNKSICYTCKVLPICPICSQSMYETKKNVCPININQRIEEDIIKEYFYAEIHKVNR